MTYLTPGEVCVAIESVTYKPGWEFSWHVHPFDGLTLRIAFSAPNVYRPGDMQDQGIDVPVPPLVSVQHFHDWLMWRLRIVELHELQEFYWVNDEIYHDPHGQPKPVSQEDRS